MGAVLGGEDRASKTWEVVSKGSELPTKGEEIMGEVTDPVPVSLAAEGDGFWS